MSIITALLFSLAISIASGSEKLPEVGLEVPELVQYYGYPIETHQTQTEDGYLLTIHRIPYQGTAAYRGVVLLVPGLFSSSSIFVLTGQQKGLAFLLVNLGYDVWITNPRGTTHSRAHATFDPDDEKSDFWDFSFHDIGYYDVPATIDYVLTATGQSNLFYIGHSQGTTSFFVTASERPEYNEKIRLMIALAPVAFMEHIPNPYVQLLSKNEAFLKWILNTIEFYELMPHWSTITDLGEELCSDGVDTQELCAQLLYALGGPNEKQLNKTMIPVIASTLPAGASVKQMIHYSQEINSGKFRQYDYGIVKNLIKYGKLTPPEYELSNIVAPVALIYGANDYLAAVEDVQVLVGKLPNVVYALQVADEEFSHLDFLWAIDINTLVHDYVFQIMNNY